jgi:hypothetical protein
VTGLAWIAAALLGSHAGYLDGVLWCAVAELEGALWKLCLFVFGLGLL